MKSKGLAASLALVSMPVVADAQIAGTGSGWSSHELEMQIESMNGPSLRTSDGKPIMILGPDGQPVVIYDLGGLPRPQDWQIPNLFPQFDTDDNDSPNLFIEQLRKRLEKFTRPIGPETASQNLITEINKLRPACRTSLTSPCAFLNSLQGSADRLAVAAAAAPDCELASARFGEVYTRGRDVWSEAARAFDMACLGSFAPRQGDGVGTRPEVLTNAETDGTLDVVGLLEANGEIICAGLLRPDRKFITARHCIEGRGSIPLKVRFASKAHPVMNVQGRPQHLPWSELGVKADWAVLELEPGPPLPIPASRLTRLRQPRAVSLVGFFRYVQPDVYAPGSVSFERDLRFPRDGFCEAIDVLSGCLQLACQTVPGFSGTPIIASRGADGSVEVIGFLSRSEGNDSQCRSSIDIRNSTFAVSASVVEGI